MSDSIHLIITGGTIDSYYEGSLDTVKPGEKSVIPAYIKGLKLYFDVECTEVCMKDSRDLTHVAFIRYLNGTIDGKLQQV